MVIKRKNKQSDERLSPALVVALDEFVEQRSRDIALVADFGLFARNSAELTADMVRDAVGHKSEEVERGYYTAGDASKAKVMAVLADAVQGAVEDDADAGVA